ncbi:putative f-box domain protein [Botryosphaeria dothidea]|uniref:Putative f-box domain protein n=1 Tax=Botryosphaeria dothidea TaxID=55169 RepID=A0A8H4IQ59_9PEZI|nr:putative f-box domain protein [Botryosphaeria dothidea]KAF4305176.1 putative f-box domain protein [Botryosphaeria dothidea]
MAHLTSLPSELLLHILSFLPIRSLLAFSLASRSAYVLASSSLQTLSLGIYPTRVSSLISQLSSTSPTASPYSRSTRSLNSSVGSLPSSSPSTASDPFTEDCTVAHVIPQASELRPHTLLAFHTALTSSILSRYCMSMRHLELSIWTLTPPVADALAGLKNLRTLCLRIEDPFGRGFLRRWIINWGSTTDEEDDVGPRSPRRVPDLYRALPEAGTGTEWNKFAEAWSRLETLRLVGAEISDWQLCQILKKNPGLKELWLKKCLDVGAELLKFLDEEWEGRSYLQTLGLVDCDLAGEVNQDAVKHIGSLSNLQVLSLLGCKGLTNSTVERLNDESWHIPQIELPGAHVTDLGPMPAVIEVDPAYVDDEE